MNHAFYLEKFQSIATEIPKKELENTGLKISVVTVLESVALKVYKSEWSGNPQLPLDAVSRIFFSVWVHDKTIQEGRIYYNIHALKMRELKGYKITSRKFAEDFRNEFLKCQEDWPHVDVQFGPLTLMEGWVELKEKDIKKDVSELVHNFFKISPMIDAVLDRYRI